jgi:hypothetical protein
MVVLTLGRKPPEKGSCAGGGGFHTGKGAAAAIAAILSVNGTGRRRRGEREGLGPAMNNGNGDKTIRRTVQFKFTLPAASEQMIAMIKSAAPLYQMFGDAHVRLLQKVDDPTRFLQEIEYDAPETLEMNRQQLAADPRVQAYLQAWRTMFPGAIEIDVYRVV